MLNFTAKTLTGAEFTGTSLAGKPAVLWFWSPSCTMCDEQAVGVRRAAKGFAGKVNVVGVAVEGDAAAQRQFIDKWELGGLPHLPDAGGTLAKRFSITGPGTFVMIDSAGEIDEVGTFNSDRLLKRVDLLAR